MVSAESRISRWLRSLARNGVGRIRTAPNRNNNATKEFGRLLMPDEHDPNFILEDRSRLLIQSGCFDEAVSILETIGASQGQQLMLGECYLELGRYSDGLQCSVKLIEMLTIRPRPTATELMKLVDAYLASSYDFRALLLLRCAAKLFALEASEGKEAISSLTSIEKCSYQCFCLIDGMVQRKAYHRTVARECGPMFIIEMFDLCRKIKSSDCVTKVELEAKILNNIGLCYRCVKCHVAATRYLRDGIDLMQKEEVATISQLQTLGNLYRNMGIILHDKQDYCAARTCYLQSLEVFGKAEKLRMMQSSVAPAASSNSFRIIAQPGF